MQSLSIHLLFTRFLSLKYVTISIHNDKWTFTIKIIEFYYCINVQVFRCKISLPTHTNIHTHTIMCTHFAEQKNYDHAMSNSQKYTCTEKLNHQNQVSRDFQLLCGIQKSSSQPRRCSNAFFSAELRVRFYSKTCNMIH